MGVRIQLVVLPSFNPTLVRLRPSLFPVASQPQEEFQSHAGSIEAPGGAILAPPGL